ncbi:prepro-carboxypeptidase Z [Halteromyces radiatus]|uniref:prepro-carboxypeptidase Z n=1 Tax=Halteromyces radiatus TaxID=101107 RepID=UPI00221F716F|nr:prepro-carboxypeptidase Z [Halteromyces radiatus]KAI8089781.1 prepro-carboxypeptidase Z [Halteromyces radiatus]
MFITNIIIAFCTLQVVSSIPVVHEIEKHPVLCDPSVIQHSGYITLSPGVRYFYWFFESQTDPNNAPLTVWLNGGPGCSSMVGLWQELGPCKIEEDGESVSTNPFSWNKYSNLLFFDQPAGVGFSLGDDLVDSSEAGAVPAYNFLLSFMKRYPKYASAPLHFFGESYAGHYIPVYADYIMQQNQLVNQGLKENPIIHLKSIGIGNGWTNSDIQMEAYPTMACNSTYGPVVSEETCQRMRNNMPACLKRVNRCHATGKNSDCAIAEAYCNTHVVSLFDQSRRSYYDVRTSDDPRSDYVDYLNKNTTKEEIGATGLYEECSDKVFEHFVFTGDSIRNTDSYVANVLNQGIRVLLYAGDADYICSWYGNYAWSSVLKFDGSDDYQTQKMEPWLVDGIEAGQIQSGGNLTFIRIYEAGHEVPYYQPKAALQMFNTHIQT